MENERSYIGDAVEAAMKVRSVLFYQWMLKNGYTIKDDLENMYDDFDKWYKKQSDRKTINDF